MSLKAILPGAENLRGGGQEAEDRLQRLRRAQAQRHQGQHRLEGRQVLLSDQVTRQGYFGFCFNDGISIEIKAKCVHTTVARLEHSTRRKGVYHNFQQWKTYKHMCRM